MASTSAATEDADIAIVVNGQLNAQLVTTVQPHLLFPADNASSAENGDRNDMLRVARVGTAGRLDNEVLNALNDLIKIVAEASVQALHWSSLIITAYNGTLQVDRHNGAIRMAWSMTFRCHCSYAFGNQLKMLYQEHV